MGTFSWYASIGNEVGASCDGRFSGDPITPNFSPNFGMDLNGPTAAVKSYVQMAMTDLAAGAPLDLRFSASSLRGEAGTARLGAFIQAFIALGGNILTITVADAEELASAPCSNRRNTAGCACAWAAGRPTSWPSAANSSCCTSAVEHGLA